MSHKGATIPLQSLSVLLCAFMVAIYATAVQQYWVLFLPLLTVLVLSLSLRKEHSVERLNEELLTRLETSALSR